MDEYRRYGVTVGVNITRLLVLGVVILREPSYGYEIEKDSKIGMRIYRSA